MHLHEISKQVQASFQEHALGPGLLGLWCLVPKYSHG